MKLFVDASAMVSMMTRENDCRDLEARFGEASVTMCSAISLWETARALAKVRGVSIVDAAIETDLFAADFGIISVPIGDEERRAAVDAHARYGKGVHPARLNMGDCFAYACARTNGARLLYKGDDFSQTDMA